MKLSENIKELRNSNQKLLYAKINEQKLHLIQLRQDFLLGKLKKTSELKKVKKEIARLMTILDEKINQELASHELEGK